MNHYDALKLLALRAVMKPDGEASYRSICRWYSTTFHTPLHLVDEIPEDEVLTAYFESTCENMEDPERQDLLSKLLETDEDRRRKALAKDLEEVESFEFARQMAQEEKQKRAKAKIADVKVEKRVSMLSAADRRPASLPQDSAKPAFEKLEPDVNIKFVGAEDFEKELEGFGNMTPKEGK